MKTFALILTLLSTHTLAYSDLDYYLGEIPYISLDEGKRTLYKLWEQNEEDGIQYYESLRMNEYYNNGQMQNFQIGESWDRRTPKNDESELTKKVLKATIQVGSATGFIIKKDKKNLFILTNNHVTRDKICKGLPLLSPYSSEEIECIDFLKSNPALDYTLIYARTKTAQKNLEELELSDEAPETFTPLITVGRGIEHNYNQSFLIEDSTMCRVLLEDGEAFGAKVPSIATGCDLSPGDSGSAMVNYDTGVVEALAWGGPNIKIGLDHDFMLRNLEGFYARQIISAESSFGVSAYRILEEIEEFLE